MPALATVAEARRKLIRHRALLIPLCLDVDIRVIAYDAVSCQRVDLPGAA